MAEDAAQEERRRGIRHPVARRYRAILDRTRPDRELPDPHLPAERSRARAPGSRGLRALRPQRPPGRDPVTRHAQARLLRPDSARQPAVRAGARPRGSCHRQCLLSRRSKADRPCGGRNGARGIRTCILARQRPRLGRRAHRQGSLADRTLVVTGDARAGATSSLARNPTAAAQRGRAIAVARLAGWAAHARAVLTVPRARYQAQGRTSMRTLAKLMAPAVALAVVASASPCHAQLTVFDPANYQQNLLSALRALAAVNNQVRQLQNEAQMLLRMDRHLQSLPGSISPQLSQVLLEMQRQVASGDAIALRVQETDAAFDRLFPKTFADTLTGDDILRQARMRWDETHAAFKRTALLQGQITESTTADARLLTDILSRSEASVGALQAAQAGNELTALNVKQALQLQALLAAQTRAETIDRSRAILAQQEARQQFKSFLGDGRAYTRGK